MENQFISFAVIGLIALLLIFKSVIIVREASAVVIERFGKFQRISAEEAKQWFTEKCAGTIV